MTETKTAQTVYGDVEYETVECDSCNNEVMKEEAFRFLLFGEETLRQKIDKYDRTEYKFENDTLIEGWACEHCHENGPISFPEDYINHIIKDKVMGFLCFMALVIGFIAGSGVL